MKNLVGDFDGAEVERKITIEEAQILNTFTPLDKVEYENSTTTVSMNVKSILFLTTMTNQFHFFPLDQKDIPIDQNDMDNLYPTLLVDTAGQERFNFMQDIGIKGADGVIIFADGTNVQSIERVAHFYDMIKEESQRSGKKIPVVVFVNKQDLKEKGMYIGIDSVARWIPDLTLDIFETTNKDMSTFDIPIRNFLNKVEGFPVSMKDVRIKRVHEVY
jgi:small GTP-binding protein